MVKNSVDVKRENKSVIWQLLLNGQALTKQQIALKTGLSVASCNTYLNEMESLGQVVGEKQKLHDVGRTSVVYKLNENFEGFLGVYFELIQGIKSITTTVLTPLGTVLFQKTVQYARLDTLEIDKTIEAALEAFPNISQIIVGTPSIAENGVIRHCDIPELEGCPLKTLLEEKYQRPVFIANDMHHKVYGYSRQEQVADKIITLVNYPSGVLPGTATVHKGVMLTGKNLFAGMVGFLDYGMSKEQELKKLYRPTAEPLVVKASIALISILNPHQLLFTGDLIMADDLDRIYNACLEFIPQEYMPEFVFVPSTDEYYIKGMYWTAIDHKINPYI